MRPFLLAAMLAAAGCIALPLPVTAAIGGGNIEYTPKGAGPVLFDHAYHVTRKGLICKNCHYATFQMTGGAEYQMDMSMLTKGKFCGHCHDGKNSFDVRDAHSCVRCHKE